MLLYSKIVIPRQDPILKVQDKNECRANRNTLCKAIYNSIFEWILSKLEKELNPPLDMEDMYRSFRNSLKISSSNPPPVRF